MRSADESMNARDWETFSNVHSADVYKEMDLGLRRFMEEQGFNCIEEFKGTLLDKIALTFSEIDVLDVVASINAEKSPAAVCVQNLPIAVWREGRFTFWMESLSLTNLNVSVARPVQAYAPQMQSP